MTNMEKMPSSITEACTKEISHIVYSLPVYEMINPDLLGAFQKKGIPVADPACVWGERGGGGLYMYRYLEK